MADEHPAPGLWDWTPQPRVKAAGRPAHVPTVETTRRVISLLALGGKPKEVALAIGVSVPTLRKQYFSDPRIRAARLVIKGELLAALLKSAIDGGNVSANVELWKRIEKAAQKELASDIAQGVRAPAPKPLGKKAEAAANAKKAKGKFAPPPAPLLN